MSNTSVDIIKTLIIFFRIFLLGFMRYLNTTE